MCIIYVEKLKSVLLEPPFYFCQSTSILLQQASLDALISSLGDIGRKILPFLDYMQPDKAVCAGIEEVLTATNSKMIPAGGYSFAVPHPAPLLALAMQPPMKTVSAFPFIQIPPIMPMPEYPQLLGSQCYTANTGYQGYNMGNFPWPSYT